MAHRPVSYAVAAAVLTAVASVRIGDRADGRPLVVPVAEWSTLIGGLPGSGKSGTLRSILVGAAARCDLAIVGIDPKRLELAPWRPRLSALAVDQAAAVEVLAALVDVMEDRYRLLEVAGADRWAPRPDAPGVLVVVDELAEVVATGDPLDRDCATLLRRILAKGRAAGVCVVAATQRPSADVIPTAVRDLFGLRIAHATANRESTVMILGEAAAAGPAHELAVGHGRAGLAYVIGGGDRTPALARVWHVPGALVASTVERTARHTPSLGGLPCQPTGDDEAVKAGASAASAEPKAGLDGRGAPVTMGEATRGDELLVTVALRAAGRPLRCAEVARATGLRERTVRAALGVLAAAGRAHQPTSHTWAAT